MKIFVLGLLVIGLTITQSTPVTKKIEKRHAGESSKIEVTSKLENPKGPIYKIDDSKVGSPKVPLKIEPSKVESSTDESSKIKIEKSKEDQKHNLKLEDASDQKQVDRAKKSCKTLTNLPQTPAKFCMEITGSPSTVTICDDDRPIFGTGFSSDPGSHPQYQNPPQGPQSHLPGSQAGYGHPQTLYDVHYQQPASPVDILIENGHQQPTQPSYIHVHPQSNLPSVYPIPHQPPFGYPQNIHNLHPHLHHHGTGPGQGSSIYVVPGSQGYPETYSGGGSGNPSYPIGGLKPGSPGYSISAYPGTPGSITIEGLPSGGSGGYYPGGYPGSGPGGYPGNGPKSYLFSGPGGYPGSGPGGYPYGGRGGYSYGGSGGPYSGLHQDPQGYFPLFTSCTCRQTPLSGEPGVIIRPGSLPSAYTSNPLLYSPGISKPWSIRPGHLHPSIGSLGGLHHRAGLDGSDASANLGGLGGSSSLGNFRDSTSSGNPGTPGNPGNPGLGISTNIRGPGLASSSSLGVRMPRPIGSLDLLKQEPETQISQSQRFTQPREEANQALDIWGPVTIQGQRFSRGPNESTQEDHSNESQKHLQSQTSQMTSQMATSINTHQKSPQQVHQISENIKMDDEIVRNFQIQSPTMQQFLIERARQHLHNENNPAVNERYEEMDRISNRLTEA